MNDETGTVQPIPDLPRILRETPTFLHAEAVQGFGKLPGDLPAPIDLISVSGHKIGAPKGVARCRCVAAMGIGSR
ncbi:aminotransferase class V-fold PLP-dependent enzyme [Embleya sp. NPDC050493]|uniref:aminotransferase class V-fold PLP-dependent enzyme n=1 Tax=Embleya sp. NPDC050493 TaxID=3363989 RepID=UPI0037AE2144